MAPRRPETLRGREIAGQFRLERFLGRGRSTLVYTAEDLTSGDEVAIKLLASSLTRNVGFMRRFRHVMRSACSFDHPNVVRVIAWGEERELFVVTEPAVGPLRALMLPGKGLSQGQTAALAVDVSRGLAYLAQRNLVHRRLHPSNLLIASDGRVMVSDAALAWILAHESGHQFSDFRYLAPEAGSGTTGPPTDVYALGMIMAEALTGDIPLLAGDVNATLGLRHETDLTLDGRWGRIGRAVGATGRADPERRVPAGQLDVGLMALIAQMDRSEVELPRMDPTARSDELESMRLTLRDRLPTVAAQTAATPGTSVGLAAGATTPSRANDDHRAAAADQAKPIDPPKPPPAPRRQPAAALRSSVPAEQPP
ncbi:MAG: protein kinase, partial [Candidatus Microthrix parvicella]